MSAQEQAWGLVVSVGGQISQNLAKPLHDRGARVLGTSPDDIDRAEDRHKFSSLLDDLGVDQPPWRELQSVKDAQAFAAEVEYPVLVRPSFVLSGAAMKVATSDSELAAFLGDAADVSPDHPVVVSKFIRNAKEIEFDAVCRDGIASASFSRRRGSFLRRSRVGSDRAVAADSREKRSRATRAAATRRDRRHDHELRHQRARRERRRA